MSEIAKLKQFISDIKEVISDASKGKISSEIGMALADDVYEDINEIFDTCVDMYYASYTPKFYKRTDALHKAYRIERNGSSISWIVGPYVMPPTHRAANNYIYEYMFEKGWHGGAISGKDHPSPGTPWYRTPPPLPGIEVPPYSGWSDYYAKKTMPPSFRIADQINRYQNNGKTLLGHNLKDLIDPAYDLVLGRYNLFNY